MKKLCVGNIRLIQQLTFSQCNFHLNQKRKSTSKDEKNKLFDKNSASVHASNSQKSENRDFFNLKNIYRKLTD